MRPTIVRVTVIAALAVGAGLAYAFSNAPPLSRTGAFAVGGKPAETNCTSCHGTYPVNSGTGAVEILGLPVEYNPGQTYLLTVRMSHDQPDSVLAPKWGFELTSARADNGASAGTILPPPPGPAPLYPDSVLLRSPTAGSFVTRQYLEHSGFSTRTGDRRQAEWQFQWIAPYPPVGRIYFFAAGNAANGNGQNDSDWVYIDAESTDVITVSVPGLARLESSQLGPPLPNPSSGPVELSYAIARPGAVELAVFDLFGRRVTTLLLGPIEAGQGRVTWNGRRDDGTRAPTGVYFARLRAPGEARTHTRSLLLAR